MKRYICDKIVKGATHVRNQMPCQDNKRIVEISDKIAIIAVADGHGSSKCPRSDRGSMIAVNSFYEVMKNYLKIYGEDETVHNDYRYISHHRLLPAHRLPGD